MAFSEIYVDPSIAGDSGAGTIGDPYGDLEYAIEQTTFDTTNGTRVNIKAGTDEIVAAELGAAMADTVTTAAWAPSDTAPVVFEGYSTTAGDLAGTETRAVLGGNGSSSIFFTLMDFIHVRNLRMTNTGSNLVCQIDNYCSVINCEVDNSTNAGIYCGILSTVMHNHVHNIAGRGIWNEQSLVAYNLIEGDHVSGMLYGIDHSSGGDTIHNIITVSGTAGGVNLAIRSNVVNNSIYSAGGSGAGIVSSTANAMVGSVMNNLIEGFSGSGGKGIDLTSATSMSLRAYGGNSVYDCETEYSGALRNAPYAFGGNETLTASPFTSASTKDFSPVNTGLIKEGSVPAAFSTV